MNEILCVLLLFVVAQEASAEPVVATALGRVRGSTMKSANGREFFAFRGIPYARPPVGELRFKDSVEADPWKEELDATKEGPTCTQYHFLGHTVGVEDCLKLNVYTPQLKVAMGMLPVMVFIHGGGFFMGSGNGETDICGPNYILDRNVVLVTLNYRLGPLGFLSTEDAEAPGNYGLLDQVLALTWVRNNILRFGGDPYSVTIFGESAGGASVEYHLLSPRSKGLFHRAIAQSGSSTNPWALQNEVGHFTKKLAESLDCPTTPSRKLIDCLRTKKVDEIASFRKELITKWGAGLFPVAFGPRIDAERDSPFLPKYPYRLIARKMFNSVPFITGVNKNEGAALTTFLFGGSDAIQNMEDFTGDPIDKIRHMLDLGRHPKGLKIAKKVHDYYLSSKEPYADQILKIEQMLADFAFLVGVDDSALLIGKYSEHPTFYYHYNHRGQFSIPELLSGRSLPELNSSVSHGDDLLLIFSNSLTTITTPEDKKVSSILLDFWTSFAATGRPQSAAVKDEWIPIKDRTSYMKIEAKNTRIVEEEMPFHSRLSFWNELVKSVAADKDEL